MAGISGFDWARQWIFNLVIAYLYCKESSRQGFTDSGGGSMSLLTRSINHYHRVEETESVKPSLPDPSPLWWCTMSYSCTNKTTATAWVSTERQAKCRCRSAGVWFVHDKWVGGLTANLINFLRECVVCGAITPIQEKCNFRPVRVN